MTAKVLDFGKKRAENIAQKKRQFERVLFNEFVGCYTVIENNGTIFPISIVDISAKGCLLEVPDSENVDKQFPINSDVNLRLYFTKKSFIPVVIKIRRKLEVTNDKKNQVVRFGGEFDTTLPSFEALQAFINFVYRFAVHSSIDHKDKKSYFL